ncbi:MAG TPA: chemotaxis protein CheW [Candidatus Aquicultor sp.]
MEKIAQLNDTNSAAQVNQFVTFAIGDEEYAVGVLKVQEIIGYQQPTKIPNVPAFVKGVLNLRGSVVPVTDLRLKFNMNEREYDMFTVILILEIQGRTMGAIVDAVSDVIYLSRDEIQLTPDFSSGITVDFISGMGRKDSRLTILLDIDRMLNSTELAALDAA